MSRACRQKMHVVRGLRLSLLKRKVSARQRRRQNPELQTLLEKYQALRVVDPLELVLQWQRVRLAVEQPQ